MADIQQNPLSDEGGCATVSLIVAPTDELPDGAPETRTPEQGAHCVPHSEKTNRRVMIA